MTDEHSKNGANNIPLDRFSDVLDAYGSRPENWPNNERETLLRLSQSSTTAHKMLQEARALDEALDHAPEIGDVSLLEADIMSRISREDAPSNVTPLQAQTHQNNNLRSGMLWRLHGATLLAASLIIGIFIGMSDTVDRIYSFDQESDMTILLLAEDEDPSSGEENLL